MIEERIKKDGEPTSNLLRRFSRKVKMAGIVKQAKSLRFKQRPVSKLKKKEGALKRVKREKIIELMYKLGKDTKKKK